MHLTVNVICTLTVLSPFIPALHFSQTLLPVWHHIPEDTLFITITNSISGLICGTLSNRPFLFLCFALPRQSPAWIQSQVHLCAVFWCSDCHCYRYLPQHYDLHLCTMLICSSPLLYNITAVLNNTFFQYFPLFPVLYNPSFQKFASLYYEVQNSVLGPWLGILNIRHFTYIM